MGLVFGGATAGFDNKLSPIGSNNHEDMDMDMDIDEDDDEGDDRAFWRGSLG